MSQSANGTAERTLRRSPLLVTAILTSFGAAVTYAFPLPAELRVSVPFGILFAVLGLAQLASVVAVLAKPTVRRVLFAAAVPFVVVVWWAVVRLGGLVSPDPWQPVDSVIGLTDDICAALCGFTVVVLTTLAALGPRPKGRVWWRVVKGVAVAPLVFAAVIAVAVGILAGTDGVSTAAAVAPAHLPAGRRSTVEYCRPDGIPLAMDIYPPAARGTRPAPVALYIHGGGLVIGARTTTGLGALLADQQGALFTPLQQGLNQRGFVVAAIDYRLTPGTSWPAPIDDARCAVRFLRANAAGLDIDPHRIGVWGSSAGGLLVSLLGLTGSTDRSSAVEAVVDMFGPADVTNLSGSDTPTRVLASVSFGDSPAVRRAASPIDHVTPNAPPFLILQGSDDTGVPPRQSETFAAHLRAAHIPTTLIVVAHTGHSLDTPGESPSAEQLTATIEQFLTTTM